MKITNARQITDSSECQVRTILPPSRVTDAYLEISSANWVRLNVSAVLNALAMLEKSRSGSSGLPP